MLPRRGDFPLVLQVIPGVGIEAVAARRDFREGIVTNAGGIVAGASRQFGGTELLRRVRRDPRFLHAALCRTKGGVA